MSYEKEKSDYATDLLSWGDDLVYLANRLYDRNPTPCEADSVAGDLRRIVDLVRANYEEGEGGGNEMASQKAGG